MGKRARDKRRVVPVVGVPGGADAYADAAELAYRERRRAIGADPAAAPYLEQLRRLVDELDAGSRRRDALVREAREHGATWPVLAGVLGVSAQAVQQRYGSR